MFVNTKCKFEKVLFPGKADDDDEILNFSVQTSKH